MFKRRIPIDRSLYDKLTRLADSKGYASTEEFIRHVLEELADGDDAAGDDDLIRHRLKGLGYLG